MSFYCPYCGSELPDDSSFCFQCGKKIPNYETTDETELSRISKLNTQVVINSQAETNAQTTEPLPSENVCSNNNEFDLTKKGKSIASFVLGLIGVILFGSWFSFVLGIIGFFIGVSAYKHKQGIRGLIIAGMILSAIAVISRFVAVILKFSLW